MDKQIKRYINDWFTVEEIDHDTFAISEYKHWEETHCYLLCGMEKAVLIDTGLGISDIRKVVEPLTDLPIEVITTHAHWNHIGGHRLFDHIAVHTEEASWLIQDSVWFHDIVDKYVRIYTGEIKKEYYQKGYRDYGRLNYLLQQEYQVEVPKFVLDTPAIEGISKGKMILLNEDFYNHFDALPCEREMLELYRWDIIVDFIQHSTNLCISEMEALQQGKARVAPESLFVTK